MLGMCFYPVFSHPSADDMRLNSSVFLWPNEILTELENCNPRLDILTKQAQDYLQTRLDYKHFAILI